MRFLIDADLPKSLKDIFEKHGHQAFDVRDVLGPATDEEVFSYANENKLILVTRDLGFGEMYSVRHGYGLILVRLPYHFTAEKIKRIMDAFLEKARDEELLNAITVVEVGRFRIRRLR
jgi:predicted nuclease of predicted toxin-antitoxin system